MLAQARTPAGATVALTLQALYLPQRTGEVRRLPWAEVEHAAWDDPVLEVQVAGTAAPVRILLDPPGSVPEAVRERVTACIVVTEHVELATASGASAGARIIGRRPPDGQTDLRWTVIFDAGLDPADAQLRAAADRELARLRQAYLS